MTEPRKLGRKAVKTDTRTLRLERYFTAALPAPPPARDWSKGIAAWGMLGNDTLGDCTIAGVGHAVQALSANASREIAVNDAEAVSYYEAWCGYRPQDPNSDQGGICLDVLTSWRKYEFCGHKLLAFATVLPANMQHVQQAIELFGGSYIGMPVSSYMANLIQGGGALPALWDVVPDDGGLSGEGHCVWVVGYRTDAQGNLILKFISWGGIYEMTAAYWLKYVADPREGEAYALISPVFINAKGEAPNGFALAALESDLVQIN